MLSHALFESDAANITWLVLVLLAVLCYSLFFITASRNYKSAAASSLIVTGVCAVVILGIFSQPPKKTTQLTVKQVEAFETLNPGGDIPWKDVYKCDKHWSVGIVLGDRSAIFLTEGGNIAWGPEAHARAEKCLDRLRRIL